VKENAHRFVTKHIYDSFMGFAISQKKKLQYKALRFKQLNDTLEWFENKRRDQITNSCYAKAPLSPVLKADSNSIALFSDAM
jgi:hypothetical protein